MSFKEWDIFETELDGKKSPIDYRMFENRVAVMAGMIGDEIESILDLGAGNMSLKKYISKNISYYPVDYRRRDKDTILCNFNRKEFPEQKADAVFISGLLEYISDYSWFIEAVCNCGAKEIILSYNVRNCHEKEGQRVFCSDEEVCDYLNALSFQEILSLFSIQGYALMEKKYWNQNLYEPLMKFEKIALNKIEKLCMCSGCAACQNICPSNAIIMKAGFSHGYHPVIDWDRCIGCGQCMEICPALHPEYDKNGNPDAYAFWANDTDRKKCSSGGAAYVFSQTILAQGGKVCGAVWDEDFYVKHVCIEDEARLEKLCKSKYLQSDTSDIFRQIRAELQAGREVLFVGTPCQVAGLNRFIGEHPGIFTIDLLCMGAPSPEIFHKYLEETYDMSEPFSIQFRDKTVGWRCDTLTIHGKSGDFYRSIEDDLFEKGFHQMLFQRSVCETCQYACLPRQGDITIGDFWNIGQNDASWDDGLGTSLVFINSHKGEQLLSRTKERIKRIERKDYQISVNRVDDFSVAHRNRDRFYQEIKTKKFNQLTENLLEEKADIGLVCMMEYNFGNIITNYALYRFLKDQNYMVLMIDMPSNTLMAKKCQTFDDRFFLFKHMPYGEEELAPQYKDRRMMAELNNRCGMFLLASDQVLRFTEDTDYYTCMGWVGSDKYKLAYAASFGMDTPEFTKKQIGKCKYFLRRIQKMSVRESSGVDIAKKYFDIDATMVLDPVFLCGKKYYDAMISDGKERLPVKPYTAAYLLDVSVEKSKAVLHIADRLTDKCQRVVYDIYDSRKKDWCELQELENPKVEEWLALIAGCEFLVTDSFHGTCFAVLFHKPFCVYYEPNNWRGKDRASSLLKLLGLSDRLVSSREELMEKKLWENPVDYSRVDKILSLEIQKSREWLLTSLKAGEGFTGEYGLLDMITEELQIQSQWFDKKERLLYQFGNELYMAGRIHPGKIRNRERADMTKIIGFGAGQCFERNIKRVKEFYNLQYVCDNSPEKWGKTLRKDVKCISPKELREMDSVFVVIMIDSAEAAFDVVHQLMGMRIYSFDHVSNWIKYMEGNA